MRQLLPVGWGHAVYPDAAILLLMKRQRRLNWADIILKKGTIFLWMVPPAKFIKAILRQ